MHLATQEDLPFIDEVMNHPAIRPHILDGEGKVDVGPALSHMWTVVEDAKGVMMGEPLGDCNYLALVAFLPKAWGPEAVASMREGIRLIFSTTDCHRLWGSVPPKNIRAARNLIAMGMKQVRLNGNRVTGYIDYLDILDEDMFRATVKAGWSGKALFWWGIKAKLENIPNYVPLHPTLPMFMLDGEVYDFSKT